MPTIYGLVPEVQEPAAVLTRHRDSYLMVCRRKVLNELLDAENEVKLAESWRNDPDFDRPFIDPKFDDPFEV